MRDEGHREAEELRDLGRVLVRADLVRRDVLEHGGGVRALLQGAARAGDAGLRRRPRRSPGRRRRRAARARGARRSRSSRGSRSAGRWAARARGARSTSSAWKRMRTTPRGRRPTPGVDAPQAARASRCRGSRRRAPRRPRAPRRSGRTQAARRGRFARAAGRAPPRLAGERVGAERDELEPGMREHAVERLLACEARRPEDCRPNHSRIMQ